MGGNLNCERIENGRLLERKLHCDLDPEMTTKMTTNLTAVIEAVTVAKTGKIAAHRHDRTEKMRSFGKAISLTLF